MSPDIEADFQRELALLEAESLGWTPLEPGVYLHVSVSNATEVLVAMVAMAALVVLATVLEMVAMVAMVVLPATVAMAVPSSMQANLTT